MKLKNKETIINNRPMNSLIIENSSKGMCITLESMTETMDELFVVAQIIKEKFFDDNSKGKPEGIE